MKRTHTAALLALVVAIPAATAGSFVASNDTPCFIADDTGYRISDSASANFTVRIDNAAAKPDLRLQLVDDSAAADFVLVDDGDAVSLRRAAPPSKASASIPQPPTPDLTVALSRAPAAYKIYVRSADFSQQDAAALFAVIWQNCRQDRRFRTRIRRARLTDFACRMIYSENRFPLFGIMRLPPLNAPFTTSAARPRAGNKVATLKVPDIPIICGVPGGGRWDRGR